MESIQSEEFIRAELAWKCLARAVSRFNSSRDRDELLCPPRSGATRMGPVGERAITYRLALHLENELWTESLVGGVSRVVVDCEYNRHIGGTKSVRAEEELRIREIVKKAKR